MCHAKQTPMSDTTARGEGERCDCDFPVCDTCDKPVSGIPRSEVEAYIEEVAETRLYGNQTDFAIVVLHALLEGDRE